MRNHQKGHLKVISILAALAAVRVSAGGLDDPPTGGKFFYAQLFEDNYQFYTKTIIGTSAPGKEQQMLPLIPTTQEFTLGIFSIWCTLQEDGRNCDVQNYYNHNKDNGEHRDTKGIATERAYMYQDGLIMQTDMMGLEIKTDLNFTVPEYFRESVLDDIYMLSIQELSKPYTSEMVSGYLGLGPYTGIDRRESTHLKHDEVLLFELKERHHIEHQTISVYVSANSNEPSFLKFGSYDPEGFANPADMGIFYSVAFNSWALEASGSFKLTSSSGETREATFGEGSYQTGNFEIEPGFPFFYVPNTFFRNIVNTFAKNSITLAGAEFLDDRIKFNTRCFDVNPGASLDLRFKMVTHDGKDKEFFFDITDLLVDGLIFGEENTCYLGVFKNTNSQYPATTYAGILFLKKYYTFYDMSGLDNDNFILDQRLRVGVGLRNPNNYILDKQYDKFFNGYAPNLYDQSQFTYQPNPYTYHVDDPNDPNSPNYHGNKSATVVTIVVVFGSLILAILVGLFILRYREQKKKQQGYLALSNFGDAMRPSEMGDSTTNINYSLNEDLPDKKPPPLMSINQSEATINNSEAVLIGNQDI